MKELEEIRATVGVPMKFVHIIRNPFDNIATLFLRVLGARNTAPDQKVNGIQVSLCNSGVSYLVSQLYYFILVKRLNC